VDFPARRVKSWDRSFRAAGAGGFELIGGCDAEDQSDAGQVGPRAALPAGTSMGRAQPARGQQVVYEGAGIGSATAELSSPTPKPYQASCVAKYRFQKPSFSGDATGIGP
jgi:hypothetical protein